MTLVDDQRSLCRIPGNKKGAVAPLVSHADYTLEVVAIACVPECPTDAEGRILAVGVTENGRSVEAKIVDVSRFLTAVVGNVVTADQNARMITDHVLELEVDQVLAVKDSVGTEDVVFEAVIPLVIEAQASQNAEVAHGVIR